MEQFVKNTRSSIDSLLEQSQELGNNRELALARTHIQSGFMWLGLVLGALGAANPYPESHNPESKVIEKHADKAADSPNKFDGIPKERIAAVKWLRDKLQNHIKALGDAFFPTIPIATDPSETQHPVRIAMDKLIEAKMWFGQELNNIRVQQESENNNVSPIQ